jgi:alpha-1,3-rhamnosyl/mannosyltransferase
MSVAGADPTKNIVALVEAFAALPAPLRQGHDLVLAGDVAKRQDVREAIDRAGIAAQTKLVGVVSDEALIHWYQRARLFVFPSLYEGFGLPVLEAMACGIPVVCSDSSSLPEVAGDAALLTDPRDVTQLSAAIARLLDDPILRCELSERGRARALTFSWDRTAAQTVALYRKVLAGPFIGPETVADSAVERIIS